MKIDRNLKNGLPNLVFEKSDISDLAKVQEMFDGKFHCNKCGTDYNNDGWLILKNYLNGGTWIISLKRKDEEELN